MFLVLLLVSFLQRRHFYQGDLGFLLKSSSSLEATQEKAEKEKGGKYLLLNRNNIMHLRKKHTQITLPCVWKVGKLI